MVDSLPPSGTDPDNQTIITNSSGKLSVPLDGGTLAVGSSGKVQVFGSRVYLADFKQDPGDWTGIENDKVSNGYASVFVSADIINVECRDVVINGFIRFNRKRAIGSKIIFIETGDFKCLITISLYCN